ncbi:MAG: hypothetical protein LBT85_01035 [Bifidobacteriaceae bacterium]|jgi:hypothetical protein|nr:hypothetical protein [Bifidobacteriaceae bacterium]
MNITMNELFKSKKIKSNNTVSFKSKFTKKLGIFCVICLFGISAFISGYNINSYAASSSTVLSVSRGGTGQNTLANVMGVGSANKLSNPVNINWVPFDGTTSIRTGSNWYFFPLIRDIDADDDPYFSYLQLCSEKGADFPAYGGYTTYLTFMSNSSAAPITSYIVEVAYKNSGTKGSLVKKLLYRPTEAQNSYKLKPAWFFDNQNRNGCINGWWYFRIPKAEDIGRYMFWQSSNSGDGLLTQILDKELKNTVKDFQWNYFQEPNGVFPTPTPTDEPIPVPTPTPEP